MNWFLECWIFIFSNSGCTSARCKAAHPGGWGSRVGNQLLLASISASSTEHKKIQTSHNLFRDLEQIKHSQLVGQAAEIKFESKFKPLLVILQSLLKAVPEDNRRFWLKNQWQSSWGRAPAELWLAGRVRTNTGRFRVSSSRCGQWQSCLRKKSCGTNLLPRVKNIGMLGRLCAVTLLTTTYWGQHPRQCYKGANCENATGGKGGFKLATVGIQFCVFTKKAPT